MADQRVCKLDCDLDTEVAALKSRLASLEEWVSSNDKKLDEIRDILNMAKGGMAVFIKVCVVFGFAAGLIAGYFKVKG